MSELLEITHAKNIPRLKDGIINIEKYIKIQHKKIAELEYRKQQDIFVYQPLINAKIEKL